MKRFLLSFLVLPLLCVFTKAVGQACNISDVVISNNVVTGTTSAGKCRVIFDASFTIANGTGTNNYITIQTYLASATRNGSPVTGTLPNSNPGYFSCNNGTSTTNRPPGNNQQLGSPLLNIVINNSGATPSLSANYPYGNGISTVGVLPTSTIEKVTLPNGSVRFTLRGLQLDMPYACNTNTEYTYVSNIFTTATTGSNATINCVNCGLDTPFPSLDVSGTTNCNVVTANFNNFSSTATTVNYSLYSDTNGDGMFVSTANGGQDQLISSGSINVPAATTRSITENIASSFVGKDVFVVVTLGVTQLVERLETVACPAQTCSISSIMIQNPRITDASASDGICRATFDATFTMANNSNNKYIFIQTYLAAATQNGVPVPQNQLPNANPDYFGCASGTPTRTAPPRTAAEVGNPLLNIVIDNSGPAPVLSTTYLLSSGIAVRGVVEASDIRRDVLPNGDIRFTLTDLQLDMPFECTTNTEYTFVSNLFTTATTNATAVNCINCGVTTPLPTLLVSGVTNCNAVTANFNNGSTQNLTLSYSLYSDVDGDGIMFSTSNGGQDLLITSRTVTVNAGQTVSQGITIPNSFAGKDVFVVVNLGAGQLVQLLPTIECTAPLPVTFKSFTAKRLNTQVALTWETAMESNNRGFSVQRNTGRGWTDIAFVETKANGGNSSSLLTYEFNEANAEKSVTQYRLLQVDFDGKSKLSEIRSVRGLSQASRTMIYPNPSNDGSVSILFDEERGNRDVLISDMGGRIIKQYRQVGASTMRVDQLNPGMYSIRIVNQATGTQTVEKLIINK